MNKAFELILERLESDEKHTFDGCINKRYAKQIVQEVAEEYNDGWIPVSVRLPKQKQRQFGNPQKRTDVLVTLRNGVVKEMTFEFATKEFWEAGDKNPIEHWKEDVVDGDFEVIAWRPLPEPFKPLD